MSAQTTKWRDDRDRRAEAVAAEFYDPYNFADKLPHHVGLDPLGCGRCGAAAIMDHPCPECGYAPARDDGQAHLGDYGDE